MKLMPLEKKDPQVQVEEEMIKEITH